ncbi:VanZ family protein [Dokdonia sp. Hel_I_53]|uniref:VanZ family protein n=1 Tax=Dokdonia sp. Hel_I_53 TaxID=1566287 RepID=UPI00119A8C42|nr:VanZ family protein [Dokdonia sp. Hel_I_53]TVZ52235.1 VanZ like protein [Dokdonia sp. Hel_I_53]
MESSWVRKGIAIVTIVYTIALTVGSLIKPVVIKASFSHVDKLIHLCAYLGLAFLWMSFYQLQKRSFTPEVNFSKIHFVIAVMIIVYGIIIEVLQGGITNYRTPDVWDVLANTIGVFIGSLIFVIIFKNFKRLKSIN